jgi:WxcM-like, C-terminal
MNALDAIKVDTLPTMRNARGALTVLELDRFIPFPVVRLFYVWDVPTNTERGQHAHRRCSQYLICASGRLEIKLNDGVNHRHLELSAGNALLIMPGIFAAEIYRDSGTVLLVLCDRPYEKDDYIYSVDEFEKPPS